MRFKRRKKVTVVYRNGARIDLRCRSFSVSISRLTSEITKVTWEGARPRPLHAGVDQIVAVWTR